MKRMKYLFGICIAISVAVVTPSNVLANSQPNFLVISVDDLKRVVGSLDGLTDSFLKRVYPNDQVRARVRDNLSPNIDALAQKSLLFRNAHAAAPVCNPSRVAILTGVRPSQSGVKANPDYFRSIPTSKNLITLPENLKNNGYYTAGIGKIFHRSLVTLKPNKRIGSDWPDSQRSWTHWVNRHVSSQENYINAPYSQFSNMLIDFGESRIPLEDEYDSANARFIATLLKDGTSTIYDETYRKDVTLTLPEAQPFYLSIGFGLPHEPFVAPKELLDLFDVNDMELTKDDLSFWLEDVKDLSFGGKGFATTSFKNNKLGGDFQKLLRAGNFIHGNGNGGDVLAWKSAIKHYLASVAVVDRGVGAIMQALENSQYNSNTVVVLHTDHGYHLGEKNRFGKNTLWDEATGSVLIVHKPNETPAIIDSSVSLMDIYPTIMNLAGVSAPDNISGSDLSVFFDDQNYRSTSPSLTVHGSGANRHSIRTEKWRYIRFKGNLRDTELYNTVDDPYSINNIVNDPEYMNVRIALNNLLDDVLSGEARAPIIAALSEQISPSSGASVSLQVEAWSGTGEELTYSAIGLPSGLVIDQVTGEITGQTQSAGFFNPTVSVTAPAGVSTSTFSWSVIGRDTVLPTWANPIVTILAVGGGTYLAEWSGAELSEQLSHYIVNVDGVPMIESNNSSAELDFLVAGESYTLSIQAVDLSGNVSNDGPNSTIEVPQTVNPVTGSQNVRITLDGSTSEYEVLSFGKQDKNGEFVVSDLGNTITLSGNTWKYIPLDFQLTDSTVITLDFQSISDGGVQGVALEIDLFPSSSKTVKLAGRKRYGITDYISENPTMNGTYQIPIGKHLRGRVKYLVFVNDHDTYYPTAAAMFSNLQITTGSAN